MSDPAITLAPTSAIIDAARRLQALGYPLTWQETVTGSPVPQLVTGRLGPWAHAEHLTRITLLAQQLGDAMAVPSTHITPLQIKAATRDAGRAGYHPPACYDDDGAIIEGAAAGHAWGRDDAYCARRLDVLDLLLNRADLPYSEMARLAHCDRRTVDRVAKTLRQLHAGFDARAYAAWHDDARRALAEYRADEENATVLALRLQIVDDPDKTLSPTNPARAVLADRRTAHLRAA